MHDICSAPIMPDSHEHELTYDQAAEQAYFQAQLLQQQQQHQQSYEQHSYEQQQQQEQLHQQYLLSFTQDSIGDSSSAAFAQAFEDDEASAKIPDPSMMFASEAPIDFN
jgi:hypothetical protein